MAMELCQFSVDFPNPGDFIRNFLSHVKPLLWQQPVFLWFKYTVDKRENPLSLQRLGEQ